MTKIEIEEIVKSTQLKVIQCKNDSKKWDELLRQYDLHREWYICEHINTTTDVTENYNGKKAEIRLSRNQTLELFIDDVLVRGAVFKLVNGMVGLDKIQATKSKTVLNGDKCYIKSDRLTGEIIKFIVCEKLDISDEVSCELMASFLDGDIDEHHLQAISGKTCRI